MKNLITTLLFSICFLVSSSVIAQTTINTEEREKAIEHLKNSEKELIKSVKGLSEDQLNFKASEEAWSIAECVEHLAISESMLFGLMQKTLEADADPSLRSEVKMTDDQIIGFISNRDTKVKTQEPFEPKESFGGFKGSMKEFLDKRQATIAYMTSTTDDLRNHYHDFPFGKMDSFQIALFLSGHSVRHTLQIKEVMNNPEFPGGLTNR